MAKALRAFGHGYTPKDSDKVVFENFSKGSEVDTSHFTDREWNEAVEAGYVPGPQRKTAPVGTLADIQSAADQAALEAEQAVAKAEDAKQYAASLKARADDLKADAEKAAKPAPVKHDKDAPPPKGAGK